MSASPGMMASEVGGVVLPVAAGAALTSPVCTESEEGSISSHASLLMMSCSAAAGLGEVQ